MICGLGLLQGDWVQVCPVCGGAWSWSWVCALCALTGELGRDGLAFLGGGRVNRVQGSVRGITCSGTLVTDMMGSSWLVQAQFNSQSTVPKGPKCAMAIVHPHCYT